MLSNDPAAIYLPEELNEWLIAKASADHDGSFRKAMFTVLYEAKRREDAKRIEAAKADPASRPRRPTAPSGHPTRHLPRHAFFGGVRRAGPGTPGLRQVPRRLHMVMDC
jgi:hypothetical protein